MMERGYRYHANFIYNRPKLRYRSNEDCDTSLEIVNFAVDMMASWGYNNTYYHDRDALPGGNIFDEFFQTVKLSRFTVVIVTKGFVNDSWAKYKSQAAFAKLLEKERSNRFIAFYIDIDVHDIPNMLILNEALQFNANWRTNLQEWNKLQKLLSHVSRPVQDTGRDPYPQTYNPGQPITLVTSRQIYSENQNLTTRQGGQENSYQRNPTTGRQGHDITTDSSDTQTSSTQRSSEDITETSTRFSQETRPIQRSSEEMAIPSRSPPDGEVSQNNQNSVKREDSTDTNLKGLVGGDDENSLSSLDQTDVEVDTEQPSVQGTQLDSVPRLDPTSMQNVERTCSNDIPSIDCRIDGNKSSPQVSANNNSDGALLQSRMYSLVRDNRFKFVFNTFTTITNAITKCDQI